MDWNGCKFIEKGAGVPKLNLYTKFSDRNAAAGCGIVSLTLATAVATWLEFIGSHQPDPFTQSLDSFLGTVGLFFLVPFWGLLRKRGSKPITLLCIAVALLCIGLYSGRSEPDVWVGLILCVPGVYAVLTTNEQRTEATADRL